MRMNITAYDWALLQSTNFSPCEPEEACFDYPAAAAARSFRLTISFVNFLRHVGQVIL